MIKRPSRVVIMGCCGSGKTNLARRVSEKFESPLLSLDLIVYERPEGLNPDGSKPRVRRREGKEVKRLMDEFLAKPNWVLEGVYGIYIKEALETADLLIWIDRSEEECIQSVKTRDIEMMKKYGRCLAPDQLERILGRIREYRASDAHLGFDYHRSLFEGFRGERRKVRSFQEIDDLFERL